MPWKASSVMDERVRFISRLLAGESMTELCREYGISRKTGYKFRDRYKSLTFQAWSDPAGKGRDIKRKKTLWPLLPFEDLFRDDPLGCFFLLRQGDPGNGLNPQIFRQFLIGKDRELGKIELDDFSEIPADL